MSGWYWLLYAALTAINGVALYGHYLFAQSTWNRLQDMRQELEDQHDGKEGGGDRV